jgi:hypothetical protein
MFLPDRLTPDSKRKVSGDSTGKVDRGKQSKTE